MRGRLSLSSDIFVISNYELQYFKMMDVMRCLIRLECKFKNLLKISCMFLVALLVSCNDAPKTFPDLFTDKITQKLCAVEKFPTDSLGEPDAILAVDKYWFFLEPKLKKQLTCYNVLNNSFCHKLSKGNGSDEVIGVQTIGLGKSSNEIYITDIMKQNILRSVVGDSISEFSIDRKWDKFRFCDVAYDDDVEFAVLVGENKRFGIRKKDEIRLFGENVGISGVSPEVVSQVLQGPCFVSPIEKKIVWFSVYGDVMEVYDYTDLDNIVLVESNVVCLPVFDKSFSYNKGVIDLRTKLGVSSLTATKNYIYALYNKRNLKEALENRNDAFIANTILLFTWDGKPYKMIEVDKRIKSITYDEKNNVILCLGLNENLDYTVFYFPAI